MGVRERSWLRTERWVLVAVAAGWLTACEDNSTLPEDPDLVSFEGIVVDPVMDDAGVADAWIIVDTGDELISVRSGADGGFSIPDLPGDTAITLTVAAEDRRAVTDGGLVLADEDLPLEISCAYRDIDFYDFPTMTISGTVSGAPVGSYLFFNGPDYWGQDYLEVESTTPVPFQFVVDVLGVDAETYTFAAMALDGTTGDILGAAAATVDVADSAEAHLEWGKAGLADLLITTNQPSLDGVLLEELDSSEYIANLSLVFAGEDRGAILGWAEGWEAIESGFEISAWYTPVAGFTHSVSAYLTDDIMDDGPFAYGRVPLDAGDTAVHVNVLDSPALDDAGDFGPGGTISWAQVPGAEHYSVYILDDDMASWWLHTESTEVSFPRLPEGFDTSLLAGGGQWYVRASKNAVVDGEFDLTQPYLVSVTPGGQLVW